MKKGSIFAGMVVVGVIVASLAGLYWWKNRAREGPRGGGEPPQFVEVISAKAEAYQPMGRLVGTVIGKRTIMVANEVTGVVTKVGFDSGATVEPGQVLLTLDASAELADLSAAQAAQRVAGAAIEAAQANAHVAETDVEWANANYTRYKDARASVSLADVDKARTDLDRANAVLARSRAAVEQARAEAEQATARIRQIQTTLDKKTIKAPYRARVGMRSVHEGQYLAEGTQVVSLTELTEDIYVDFGVPQEYVSLVVPGTTVTAKSSIIGAPGDGTASIRVLSMDATVNPVTRNVRVRTSVPNPGFVLKPGMSVDVEVPIGPPQPSVTVPSTAVRRAAFGDHVFVLDNVPPAPPAWAKPEESPGKGAGDAPKEGAAPQGPPPMWAHQRIVTLGTNLGDRVIIAAGLKEGEKIASSGSFKLRDGSMVFDSGAMKQQGAADGGAPEGAPKAEKGEGAPAAGNH